MKNLKIKILALLFCLIFACTKENIETNFSQIEKDDKTITIASFNTL